MINNIELKDDLPKNKPREADADEIERRRVMQFRLRLEGHKRAAIIEKLTNEFDISDCVVDNDWRCREKWIGRAADITDINSIVASIKGTDEMAQEQLRDSLLLINQSLALYRDEHGGLDLSPDSPAFSLMSMRNQYVKTLADINKSYRDNMNKLGILKEAPRRVEIDEHSVQHRLDWAQLLDVLQPMFEKYPESKEVVRKRIQDIIHG